MAESAQSLGTRVARARRLRGMSQSEFAARIDRSVAWVSQVERGVRHIDRLSVLEMLAEKLDMPLSELASDEPVISARAPMSESAEQLRAVLLSTVQVADDRPTGTRPEVTQLASGVDEAWALVHAGAYERLPALLAGLITSIEQEFESPDAERPWELLASIYHAMAAAFAKLGETDAAWIASDRALNAARLTKNPVLVAAGAFRLAVVFQGARRHEYVERLASTIADTLEPRLDELGTTAQSVYGALTLQRAVAAARANDADKAYALLETARSVADKVGPGRNDHHTEFGPLNVALHEVSVAVDLGDAGRALRAASGIETAGLSPERHSRLLIDTARAHSQRRDSAQAVACLVEAEASAPAMVHDHYAARQMIGDLLALADNPSPELLALARRSGVVRA